MPKLGDSLILIKQPEASPLGKWMRRLEGHVVKVVGVGEEVLLVELSNARTFTVKADEWKPIERKSKLGIKYGRADGMNGVLPDAPEGAPKRGKRRKITRQEMLAAERAWEGLE